MMKTELAHTIARRNGVSTGNAADDLDRTVMRLLRGLRNGKPAKLPGIGTIEPGQQWTLRSKPGESTRPPRERQ